VEQKSLRADFKWHPIDLSATPLSVHEDAMRLAIAAARGNPAFPFGAVIVRKVDRQVMATGVNTRAANPTYRPLGTYYGQRQFIILAGAIERGWKIPRSDIETAERRLSNLRGNSNHARPHQYDGEEDLEDDAE